MYPTLFISHGAPNIILGNSKSKKNIEKLGTKLSMPKYIIVVSAHYVTRSLKVINPTANKIMYDFYGFEDELYNVQYEIKSEEFATFDIVEKLKAQNIRCFYGFFFPRNARYAKRTIGK
jgi:4,5-DOPA dioxygenase extradiol